MIDFDILNQATLCVHRCVMRPVTNKVRLSKNLFRNIHDAEEELKAFAQYLPIEHLLIERDASPFGSRQQYYVGIICSLA